MKYKIEDLREAETEDVDITEFFPSAKEKVFITIRRLTTKNHNDVIALMTMGGEIKARIPTDDEEEGTEASFSATNTSWYTEARMIQLLGGVVQNEKFPFEKWDEQIVNELDERNPLFITFLQERIRKFDRPLARKLKTT